MRHAIITLGTVAACLFLLLPAHAEDSSYDRLLAMNTKLLRHAQNLADMLPAMSTNDASTLTEMHTVADTSNDAAGFILDLLYLAAVMASNADRTEVKFVLNTHRTRFDKACRENIRYLNVQIGTTQSSGLASEGGHLRDDLVTICDYVRSLNY